MNSDIKAIVDQLPLLSLQVNIGEKHRIMHSGIKLGSLWIEPRVSGYNVLSTGDAETLLLQFLYSHFGVEKGENSKGRKYWEIPDIDGVAKIIQRFAEPH